MLIAPFFALQYPSLVIGQSTRHGGVSNFPARSLNLGLYTQDKPASVIENRAIFSRALEIAGSRWAGARQVHGTTVQLVEKAGEYPDCDALITQNPEILLTITTADCIPVLIFDPVSKSYGAAHAGWRGTAGAIATKLVAAMQREFNVRPADCLAYLATGISANYFEVQNDVANHFASHLHQRNQTGHLTVNLPRANAEQLVKAGIPAEQIEISSLCTVANNDQFFSYRHEAGKTGRMLAVIGNRSD